MSTDPSANTIRTLLGDTLQGGALRAILILGGVSAVAALVTWLIL